MVPAKPKSKLAPELLRREAQRVLPHMRVSARYLARCDEHRFALYDRRRKTGRSVLVIEVAVVESFLHAELIELCAQDKLPQARTEALVLSQIGRAFVVRHLAGEDGHAAQHRVLVQGKTIGEGGTNQPFINVVESPLLWLSTRKGAKGQALISAEEVSAGERLHEDFTRARMTPKSTTNWPLERVDSSRRTDYTMAYETDRAVKARRYFWAAVDALGTELAPPLVAVCCYLQGLESVERQMGWPRRSGKVILQMGLQRLAAHYGFISQLPAREKLRALNLGDVPEQQ